MGFRLVALLSGKLHKTTTMTTTKFSLNHPVTDPQEAATELVHSVTHAEIITCCEQSENKSNDFEQPTPNTLLPYLRIPHIHLAQANTRVLWRCLLYGSVTLKP